MNTADEHAAASERWFQKLVRHAADLIAVLDPDGRLRYANPAAERILGLSPEGRLLLDLVHADDRPRAAETITEALHHPGVHKPEAFRVITADGRWRILEVVAENCRDDPAIAGLVLNARDVTESRAAQEAYSRSEALLQEAQRIARMGHYEWDVGADDLEWLAPEMYRIHGLSAEQWYGTSEAYWALVHPDDRQLVHQAMDDVLVTGESTIDYRIVRPDGAVRVVRNRCETAPGDTGEPARVVGVCQDITEQEHLRQDLQHRVNELSSLEQISRAANELDDVEELLRTTARALRSGMQDAPRTAVTVRLDDCELCLGQLPGHQSQITEPVSVAGRQRGHVVVGYTTPSIRFVPEEHRFVAAVADTLALWLGHRDSSASLQESQARFRRLLDTAPDMIYRYRSAAHGRPEGFDYISRSVLTMTGYRPDEFATADVIDRVIHPDDLARFAQLDWAGPVDNPEMIRLIARDGSMRWTEHRVVPVHDQDGNVVAVEGVGRDVTERVAATRTLEQRAAEQSTIAALGDAALHADDMDQLCSTAAVLVGEALSVDAVAVYQTLPGGDELRLRAGTGWPDDIIGQICVPRGAGSLAGLTVTRETPLVVADLSADPDVASPFLAGQGVVGAATVAIGGLGGPIGALGAYTHVPRQWTTEEVGFLQTAAHVLGEALERDRADKAVAQREREFRTLAEHSPDIISRFDSSYRHLYINPAVEPITGIPAAEFIGRTDRELGLPLEAVDQWERAIEEVFTIGRPVPLRISYPSPRGTVHLECRLMPEPGPGGAVETVVAVTRDLTELRRSEEQRREILSRNVDVQEQERARISEDIHDDSVQVMVAVSMRLETLKSRISDPEALAVLTRLEETVRRSIRRLRSLMFALSPPELERDGLAAALQAYLETAWHDGPAWEVIDRSSGELPTDLRMVLYRIAQEAITNARKHAGASHVQIKLDDSDAGVEIEIRDDGAGFEPQQALDAGPHHIGLTTMRERAEGAGGAVHIDSAPGHGTVVAAWVPASQVS